MPSDDVTHRNPQKQKVRVNVSGGQEPNSVILFSAQTSLRRWRQFVLRLCALKTNARNKDQQN